MGPLPLNRVLLGDCSQVLKQIPENTIDLVVTDPPYGLNFMGKEWDKALPPREAFEQVIRVLKPGALAFVMSSPRQDLMWRMMRLLEEAGFEMRQSFISWVYKTGFPKAYDVSKGIDSKLGLEREVIGPYQYDNRRKEAFGPNHGDNTYGNYNRAPLGLTSPASELAKRWEGWKSQTGLKPAHEPILMVNKPFSEPTIVDNVLKWGTGAINVDACRIPLNGEDISVIHNEGYLDPSRENWRFKRVERDNIKGRFPANLLISDGALDTGEITNNARPNQTGKKTGSDSFAGRGIRDDPPDFGDQSRYFDLDAWAQHHGILDVPKPASAERDYGLKGSKGQPKSKFNKSDGKNERFDGAMSIPRRNTHPTVKPIKLMAYLIELGCPKDGIVMDPFLGSGTTCIAAKLLQRRYIGVEINEKYHALAEARIAAYPQPLKWFMEEIA